MEEREFFRRYNANFKEVTKLEGNIGYLDLRSFYGLDYGRKTADNVMSLLGKSDAIIIDLRNNSGGRGEMSDYLVGYFFKEPTITSKTIKRQNDTFQEKTYYSPKKLGSKRMPDVPLFLLTSGKTFSAAEGFIYALKVYNRATIIGERTKGGANAGDLIPVNDELQIFVPDVSVTHPLTNDSWEGKGISADIEIESEQALDTALVLAKKAAKEFKINHDKKARKLLRDFEETVNNFNASKNESAILDIYLLCRENDLIFEDWEIRSLAYEKSEAGKKDVAEAIYKANIILYPNSPIALNSYTYFLLKNDQKEKSICIYRKAVAVAEAIGHSDLEWVKGNFKKAME